MTRVRFLRGTALGGVGNDAFPGDLRDLPDWQAAQLIAARRAVAVLEGTIPEPSAAPDSADAKPPRKKGIKSWT